MEKKVVGSMSDWSGVLKDFFRQIDDGSICLEQVRALVNHQIPDALPNMDWRAVYDQLGLSREYAEFIGSRKADVNPSLWNIPVVKGVTCNKIVAALRRLGVGLYLYTEDLDKAVTINDRDPNRDGSYAISFRRTIEADEENKNLSANDLKSRSHKGITLLERLLLELGYFLATGKHFDEKNVSLCAGSRYSNGDVPSVFWYSGDRKVYVDWCRPGYSVDDVRSRSAVS